MIGRIFLAALAAGLLAGVFVSGAQMLKVVPLIHMAEQYEGEAPSPAPHSHDSASTDAHHHHGDAWAPEDGFERMTFTVLTNILAGVGFGLLLAAGMALRGQLVGWRNGIIWGGCGYLAFSFLPALGLPPELPGMAAGDLAGRQIWWLMTAASSASGIALILLAPKWAFRVLGAALLIIPHFVGAPHPHEFGGNVPAELAAQYVTASLVTAGLFWLLLGGLVGQFIDRGLSAE